MISFQNGRLIKRKPAYTLELFRIQGYVSQVGKHIPDTTRDMCFLGRGTYITRDMCFPGG